jgi:histidinol-phosphate/aromatic aminotransferase/cobyric acid decarboxylase-like protein
LDVGPTCQWISARPWSPTNDISSQANFAFIQIPDQWDGQQLRDRLIKNHKLFVRECGNKIGSSSRYFRIAARPKEDTDRLIAALREELKSPLD